MSTKVPARLSWAVAQLAMRSRDAVLEIGCGAGVRVRVATMDLRPGIGVSIRAFTRAA